MNKLSLSLFLAMLYIGSYYIRPFEWQGPLFGAPVLQVLGVIVAIYLLFQIITGQLKLFETGSDCMLFCFFIAMLLSQLFSGWAGGVVSVTTKMVPVFLGYFAVRRALDSKDSVSVYLLVLTCITAFLGYEGWLQATKGFSHGGMTPYLEDAAGGAVNGVKLQIMRVRWYGMFNDPNDLGLALIPIVPFLIERLIQKKIVISLLALVPVLSTIYMTNSRGSMLGCAVGVVCFIVIRYRSKRSAIVGLILAVALIAFGPSRANDLSGDDESANGRIESWYEGYQMFKHNPVFGVSMNCYTDYNELTAHNSFVLVLAELGIVGIFFFTGMFYFPIKWLMHKIKQPLIELSDGWGDVSAAFGSLAALMVGMFFLSRSYVLHIYLVLALVISVILRFGGTSEELTLTRRDLKLIFTTAIIGIFGISIIVKISL